MNQDNFLWGLQITDGLTMELVSKMTVIAFGVAVICFICNLAYNYLYHGASQLLTSNEDKFPDMMEIGRCLVLFFCLTMYKPIAQTIVGTMEVINEATSLSSERANEFAQFMDYPYSDRLREIRKAHRLNQATFAEKAGISLSIYSKWEGGSRQPSRKMFRQLVNTYPEINI